MIGYPLSALQELNIQTTLVLGYQGELIKQEIEQDFSSHNLAFVFQDEQRGTGHAVAQTAHTWEEETIIVLSGDTPLITKELITQLYEEHTKNQASLSFLTTQVIDPTGYGRVVETEDQVMIIEEKNCSETERLITRINAGIYAINKAFLQEHIHTLQPNDLTQEIYLVDLVKIASDQKKKIVTIPVPYDQVRGVNTLQDLWGVEQIKRSELIKKWMLEGVRFELAQSIHLDIDVTIGAGSFIGTGVHLLRGTQIGEECFVGAFSIVANSIVGDQSMIHSHSVIQDSTLGSHVRVGPFARLREDVLLHDYTEVGNFVEVKQSSLGTGTKTKHLSYIGNAIIGKDVNIGAGTVFCNYDGCEKHETIIEDDVFVGSNNTLIAPLHIGNESYTAAGSTISHDIPPQTLAIGRARQENKIGYTHKLKSKKTSLKNDCQHKQHTPKQESQKTIHAASKIESPLE